MIIVSPKGKPCYYPGSQNSKSGVSGILPNKWTFTQVLRKLRKTFLGMCVNVQIRVRIRLAKALSSKALSLFGGRAYLLGVELTFLSSNYVASSWRVSPAYLAKSWHSHPTGFGLLHFSAPLQADVQCCFWSNLNLKIIRFHSPPHNPRPRKFGLQRFFCHFPCYS